LISSATSTSQSTEAIVALAPVLQVGAPSAFLDFLSGLVEDLPVRSSKLTKGSSEYFAFSSKQTALLSLLRSCSVAEILPFFYSTLAQPDHIMRSDVDAAVSQFVKNLSEGEAKKAFRSTLA
jgi:hypothetical protein